MFHKPFKGNAQITSEDINEFYYILPIDNLNSVLKKGILSHKRINKKQEPDLPIGSLSSNASFSSSSSSSSSNGSYSGSHINISNPEVQDRRKYKKVKRADPTKKELTLHQHVNFYLQPHNAMMHNITIGTPSSLSIPREDLCILRVKKQLLARGDGILSNRNAATNQASFFKTNEFILSPRSSETISALNTKGVSVPRYLENEEYNERKQIRQAEVLFPYEVKPQFIQGIFVFNMTSKVIVQDILTLNQRTDILVSIHESLFLSENYKYRGHYILQSFSTIQGENGSVIDYSLPESSSSESEYSEGEYSENSISESEASEDETSVISMKR